MHGNGNRRMMAAQTAGENLMKDTSTVAVRWIARITGIAYLVLLSYGWWDEVQARGGRGPWIENWAVVTHLLPIVVLLAALILAWWWPVAGAVGFLAYAVVTVFSYVPEWGYAPVVTGPPLVVGLLFLIEWMLGRRADRESRAF